MTAIETSILQNIVNAVLAVLKRDGRLPTRLDEEDFDDLRQEGIMAALVAMPTYDPDRGSLRAYLTQPIARSILRAAWKIANAGMTGAFDSVQVFRDDADGLGELNSLTVPDVAEEIEAFDHIWHTHYIRTP